MKERNIFTMLRLTEPTKTQKAERVIIYDLQQHGISLIFLRGRKIALFGYRKNRVSS